jgi:hypothetical protein
LDIDINTLYDPPKNSKKKKKPTWRILKIYIFLGQDWVLWSFGCCWYQIKIVGLVGGEFKLQPCTLDRQPTNTNLCLLLHLKIQKLLDLSLSLSPSREEDTTANV